MSLENFPKLLRRCLNFVQKFNLQSGEMEWTVKPDDYDFTQEVARSGYADMLHDEERNKLYHDAIRKTVKKLAEDLPEGQPVKAVDIGTGTGLLSMMAVRAAASVNKAISVDAYECFAPMAECALKVIANNKCEKNINVITKRSDEHLGLEEKGDLLITELFDTELIGEGAIGAYRHALKTQVKQGALAVPYKARVWIQLIHSSQVHKWNQFRELKTPSFTITPPEIALTCAGSGLLHDIQLSQLTPGKDFDLISEPEIAFEFNFTDLDTLKRDERKTLEVAITREINEGHVAVLFWWDLFMDYEEKILLSCAPYWAHPSGLSAKDLPWREHWIQAIYHLPANTEAFRLKKGDIFKLGANHDEYTFSFDSRGKEESFCRCGLHSHISRPRLGQLNDVGSLEIAKSAIERVISKSNDKINVLFIGDASFIPFVIEKVAGDQVKNIFCTSKTYFTKDFYTSFAKANDCVKLRLINSVDDVPEQETIDVIYGEPFFTSTDLPWDLLHFWKQVSNVRQESLSSSFVIIPNRAVVKAVLVQFDHLWKIRAPVTETQGFNLGDFDKLVQSAIDDSDTVIESQPLWEYPCRVISKEQSVFDWTYEDFISCDDAKLANLSFPVSTKVTDPKVSNFSVALWIEFYDQETLLLSTGPQKSIRLAENVEWCKNFKQGVAFFIGDSASRAMAMQDSVLEVKATFHPKNGLMQVTACGARDVTEERSGGL